PTIYSPFFLIIPHPPRSTLFPYTTLFRSESDPCRAFLQPVRHEQGRQRRREPRQCAALATGARLASLHQLPAGVVVAASAAFAEQVRMPPPHLLLKRVRHHFRIELRPLLRNDDLKREMQEQVAELVAHRLGIIGLNRVIELERFFDEVGTECLWSLYSVPGTALSQLAHESRSTSKR